MLITTECVVVILQCNVRRIRVVAIDWAGSGDGGWRNISMQTAIASVRYGNSNTATSAVGGCSEQASTLLLVICRVSHQHVQAQTSKPSNDAVVVIVSRNKCAKHFDFFSRVDELAVAVSVALY